MPVPLYVVDAFADRPFTGNPAAVCPLDGPRPDEWLRNVAMEMNLSETAFVWPEGDGFRLRWLTPAVEVDLCGHATLAASHVLWDTGRVPAGRTIRYATRSGTLSAEPRDGLIELDFPARPATLGPVDETVAGALGASPVAYGLNGMDAFVVVADEAEVRRLKPDFRRLGTVGVRGVIVTAQAHPGRDYDFVSRFFAPGSGIDEDPVTGSAHCCLAPYWAERLGRTELTGYQASQRGGTVRVRLVGNRVKLGGRAFTITRGELLI
jgi:PhzF family phenazine biosynthesis protein